MAHIRGFIAPCADDALHLLCPFCGSLYSGGYRQIDRLRLTQHGRIQHLRYSLHLPLLAVQSIGSIYQRLLIRLSRFASSLSVKQLGELLCGGITRCFQLFEGI